MFFIQRNCPLCNSKEKKNLGNMSIELLLKSNPGYNLSWFNEHMDLFMQSNNIVQCKNCSMVYVNEVLKDDWLYKYYNEAIDSVKSKEKIFKRQKRLVLIQIWQELFFKLDNDLPIKVLDYGAGWGDFLSVANSIGVLAYGLEFDDRKISFAKQLGLSVGDISFIETKAPYDVFFCNQVIEHLNKPFEALCHLRSLVKEGAIGFVSVPNFPINRIKSQIELLQSGQLPHKDFDLLGHLNYFDSKTFNFLLNKSGFKELPNRIKELSILKRLQNYLKFGENISSNSTSLYVTTS